MFGKTGFFYFRAMKNIISLFFVFQFLSVTGQDAYTSYRLSDSLYRAQNYIASARTTLAGIRSDKEKDLPVRYQYAAGAFAKAGLIDSAFLMLQKLSVSDRISPSFVRSLSVNKDLWVLQSDPRWKPFMEKVTKKAMGNYNIEELIYGHKEGLALSMLHLSPLAKPNGKAIIRVVAGSWYSSYASAENYVMSSYDYLNAGFRVFHVMVGSNPRYNIAEQVADVKRAVRYIRFNAARFDVDPGKLGMEGGSAGGHLSLTVAFADERINENAEDPVDRVSSRVQAVCVLYPPTDFLNWGGKGFNMVNMRPVLEMNKVWGALDFKTLNEKNMTYVPVTDTALRNKMAMEISPMYTVTPDDPPVFFMHGDADPTVPLQQSVMLEVKLKETGIKYRFIVKPGGKHNPNDMMPEWTEAVNWFKEYLK